MLPKIKGKVAYVFDEADFDTDLICGMDTCTVADPEILKRVCMQDIAPDFQKYVELWGDRIFEKCGIRRDEEGDGGKTLEIRGKRRLSARDGGANYQQS